MSLSKALCKEQKIRAVCTYTHTHTYRIIFLRCNVKTQSQTFLLRITHPCTIILIWSFKIFTVQQSTVTLNQTIEGTSTALITNLPSSYHIHTPVHNQSYSLWSDSSKHTSEWTQKYKDTKKCNLRRIHTENIPFQSDTDAHLHTRHPRLYCQRFPSRLPSTCFCICWSSNTKTHEEKNRKLYYTAECQHLQIFIHSIKNGCFNTTV